MFAIKPTIDGVILVLRGRFNPAIIQPGWLAKYDLVGEAEAQRAVVNVILPEITSLQLDHYDITVEREDDQHRKQRYSL